MKSSVMKEKLLRLNELKHKIDTEVKATYEEYGNLTAELADAIMEVKGGDVVGIPKVSLAVKFKDGRKWVLKPNYMRGGQFANLIWKPLGVSAFSIEEVTPATKE